MDGSNSPADDIPLSQEPRETDKNLDYANHGRVPRNLTLEIGLRDLVGETPAFRSVLDEIKFLADSDATVLISGETGDSAVFIDAPRGK